MYNFDPSGTSSFSPSWGASTSYNPSSGVLKGSGGGSMFPVGAALGAGASIFSGIMQGNAMNRQADAMFEAAKMQAQAAERAGFQNLLAGQYALTSAKQFEEGLQRNAANYQQAFLDPRKSVLESENRARGFADMLSPDAQKLRWQNNIDAMNRTLSEKRAVTDAMFGRVAEQPFGYGNMPGYATGSLV